MRQVLKRTEQLEQQPYGSHLYTVYIYANSVMDTLKFIRFLGSACKGYTTTSNGLEFIVEITENTGCIMENASLQGLIPYYEF